MYADIIFIYCVATKHYPNHIYHRKRAEIYILHFTFYILKSLAFLIKRELKRFKQKDDLIDKIKC